MRHYTISEAAKEAGVSADMLRVWEIRYGWPRSVRKDNGYRLFSEATIERVRAFIAAGKPFHQIEAGTWAPASNRPPWYDTLGEIVIRYDDVDRGWIRAVTSRDLGRVAFYLASLGRMRPAVRAQYVRCIQECNLVARGAFAAVMREFGVQEDKPC